MGLPARRQQWTDRVLASPGSFRRPVCISTQLHAARRVRRDDALGRQGRRSLLDHAIGRSLSSRVACRARVGHFRELLQRPQYLVDAERLPLRRRRAGRSGGVHEPPLGCRADGVGRVSPEKVDAEGAYAFVRRVCGDKRHCFGFNRRVSHHYGCGQRAGCGRRGGRLFAEGTGGGDAPRRRGKGERVRRRAAVCVRAGRCADGETKFMRRPDYLECAERLACSGRCGHACAFGHVERARGVPAGRDEAALRARVGRGDPLRPAR